MSSGEKPFVYLILGAPGSGRRHVLVDLIEAGLTVADRPAVMIAEGETADPGEEKLPGGTRWAWRDGMIVGTLPSEATHVFFVTQGNASPVDQVEVFKAWIEAQGGQLARVFCVVNCQLAEQHPP